MGTAPVGERVAWGVADSGPTVSTSNPLGSCRLGAELNLSQTQKQVKGSARGRVVATNPRSPQLSHCSGAPGPAHWDTGQQQLHPVLLFQDAQPGAGSSSSSDLVCT